MGVPSFYRWLCKKYPRVPIDAFGDEIISIDGKEIPTDTSTPNPNNIEFDNLYLDMNGIIHPCCHPEDGSPLTERDMFRNIFLYIDRIFALVRPRKVLYMAIDGVAPRAKMNQQRQRRFRSVQESQEIDALEKGLRQIFVKQGKSHLLPPESTKEHWDRNVITPGTPFMADLSEALRDYIVDRMTTDPGWKNLKVIFSDATVPGEGEHKIMNYIRNQRSQSDYNANTTHCLYGMDADLIMLSLASHEPHFYIVREIVLPRSQMSCTICRREGHHAGECQGKDTVIPAHSDKLINYLSAKQQTELMATASGALPLTNSSGVVDLTTVRSGSDQSPVHTVLFSKRENTPFQFLSISILRDYLHHELSFDSQLYDLERAVDDWVFLCFFVGNDFLPHMPSLSIRDNAVGMLTKLWKSLMLRKVQPFEASMISLIPPGKRSSMRGKMLTSLDADPIADADRNSRMSQIYLTSNGDVNLEALHDFIDKFQVFENAILYSSSTIASNNARKQARLNREKQRTETEKQRTESKAVEKESEQVVQAAETAQKVKDIAIAHANVDFNKKAQPTDGDMQDDDVTQPNGNDSNDSDTNGSNDNDTDGSNEVESNLPKTKKPRSSRSKTDDDDEQEVQLPSTNTTSEENAGFAQHSTAMPDSKKSLVDDEDSRFNTFKVNTDINAPASESARQDAIKAENAAAARDKRRRAPTSNSTLSGTADSLSFTNILVGLKEKLGMAPPSEDNVRLGQHPEGGKTYEDRYYKLKFHIDTATEADAFKHVQLTYITGLRWVLHYYYKGCSSWDWYYPYHHAPLVISLAKISLDEYKMDVSSPLNPTIKDKDSRLPHTISTTSLYSNATPILPFEQLLSVFPAASSHALPKPLAQLMTDPLSPIADFYPSQFGLDIDGKAFLWQGVVQLPFIDMDRLRRAVAKKQKLLNYTELQRNRHGVNYLYSYVDPERSELDSYDHGLELAMTRLDEQYNVYKQQIDGDVAPGSADADAVKDIAAWKSAIPTLESLDMSTDSRLPVYRKVGPLFTPIDKPKAPITSNVLPNEPVENDTKLRNASAYIQYTHDTQQWNYGYMAEPKDTVLARYILGGLDRFVEPALGQLITQQVTCQSATSTHPDNQPVPGQMTEHTQIPITTITGYLSPSTLNLQPGKPYTPIGRYVDLVPVISQPKCVSFVYTTLPSRLHVCALLKNAIKQESPLNEKDLAQIGIQKKEFRGYTYEYLCEVIKSKNVYNKEGSVGKDVHIFGDYAGSELQQQSNSHNQSNDQQQAPQQGRDNNERQYQNVPPPPFEQFGYDGFPKVIVGNTQGGYDQQANYNQGGGYQQQQNNSNRPRQGGYHNNNNGYNNGGYNNTNYSSFSDSSLPLPPPSHIVHQNGPRQGTYGHYQPSNPQYNQQQGQYQGHYQNNQNYPNNNNYNGNNQGGYNQQRQNQQYNPSQQNYGGQSNTNPGSAYNNRPPNQPPQQHGNSNGRGVSFSHPGARR